MILANRDQALKDIWETVVRERAGELLPLDDLVLEAMCRAYTLAESKNELAAALERIEQLETVLNEPEHD
jgi:hypothetical protein